MAVSEKKLEVARRLAKSHVEIDRAVTAVYLLEADDESDKSPLHLLEVVDGAVERGVEPVFFRPDPTRGIPYPFVIVELSPREWQLQKRKKVVVQGKRLAITQPLTEL